MTALKQLTSPRSNNNKTRSPAEIIVTMQIGNHEFIYKFN